MPQRSIRYALGRLSVISHDKLDTAKLDRLMQASSPADAYRALAEMGWAEGEDYEKAAQEQVQAAYTLIRGLSTKPALTDAFQMRYDVNNLKMLLKSRCLSQSAPALSPCGVFSVEALRHAVAEHQYRALPKALCDALDALEKRLAMNVNPLDIDVTLDRAYFALVFDTLPKDASSARAYFQTRVDFANALAAFRALGMGKDAAFVKAFLIEGGTIRPHKWLDAYEKPEKLPALLKGYGVKAYRAAIAAYESKDRLPALERAADDLQLACFIPYKNSMDSDERLVGYLLMREREAAAVRLIMAGKVNGFAEETVRERLRELYG